MFAAIYVPDFALQAALRHAPELPAQPVALLDDQEPRAVLFQITPAARAAGVREGMTPPQALARCRGIVIRSRSAAQERTAREILLQCASVFSPRIEATAEGVCTLDLKGLPVAAPGNRPGDDAEPPGTTPDPAPGSLLQKWGMQIIHRLAGFELSARVGVAENPGLALHAARCARPFLAVEHATAFLAGLPLESIEPTPDILSVLHKWGIRTLGEFTSLAKDRIAERLEAEGVELFERASVNGVRPLDLVQPPALFEEGIELESEIESLEPLLFILRRCVDQIARRLELAGLVAEQIHLRLVLSSGENHERTFRVPAPTGGAETLFRMLFTHLENLRTAAAITALHLSATPCRPETHQFGLFEASLRDPNQFSETLGRLTALLGSERAGTPVLDSSHRPDSFRMEPPRFEAASETRRAGVSANTGRRPGFCSRGAAGNTPGLALRRFRPPIPARVEMRQNQPALLRSPLFIGPIKNAAGPFRSSGHWWETSAWCRDEWDVETARGGLFRLYQENDEWFVEGTFD